MYFFSGVNFIIKNSEDRTVLGFRKVRSMRIIFILNNLYPNGKASTARVREYGKGFVGNGVETLVWMPVPRQPYQDNEVINPDVKGTDENGVAFECISGASKRNKNVFIRQLQDFGGYTLTLFKIIRDCHQGDYFVLYEGGSFWHRLCIKTIRLVGGKCGIELNELPYGTGVETEGKKKKRKWYLKNIFPKLDFVWAISESLYELAQEYAPKAQIIKVPIMVEGQLVGDDFSEPGAPYIFHSGSLSEQKDGICGMLEAFGMACQKLQTPIEYILTGRLEQSPHADEIRRILKKYGVEDKVHFLGYLDLCTLRKYQKNCFLTIINKYDTQQNRYCFSTKLSEYLSFSRPVITTTVGEANNYLKDGVNAFIVEPHKPELLADKIVYAVNHPLETSAIGREGHKLTETEFDCVYQTKRIVKLLSNRFS